MEFMGPDEKLVVLRGMQSYPPQIVSAHRMEADIRHGDIAWAIKLRISEAGGQAQSPLTDIHALLNRYVAVFRDIPPGQPPDRGFEHTIELEPGI